MPSCGLFIAGGGCFSFSRSLTWPPNPSCSYRLWSEGPFHSELNPEGNDAVKVIINILEDPPRQPSGMDRPPLKVFWDQTCLSDGKEASLLFRALVFHCGRSSFYILLSPPCRNTKETIGNRV